MTNNKHKPICVVIAARRGVIQEALKAMLADLSWLNTIAFAGETNMVLRTIQAQKSDLLLLDSDLVAGDVASLLCEVKKVQPDIRCLVLTETIRQQDQARLGKADAVFPYDGSVDRLHSALKDLCAAR